MRGELIYVWSDTWREIWLPLSDNRSAPEGLFCELYRELLETIKPPSNEQYLEMVLHDSLQSREAFHRVLFLAGVNLDPSVGDQIFDDSLREDPLKPNTSRRSALENAIATAIDRPEEAPSLFSRALQELATDPKRREEAYNRVLENIYNDSELSRQAFQATKAKDLVGERGLIDFIESVHGVLDGIGGDSLSNSYFGLIAAFVEKFSLRYDLRRPCLLCPTLSGVFAGLVRELRTITAGDAHLDTLMKDFEGAIRDIRSDSSEGRIKTCIQKQMNLLEALGQAYPGVSQKTLGKICDQVGTWPHAKVKDSIKSLYGFASDYPGIRHGGTRGSALRPVDMRDMVAISVLLTGFTPYLATGLQSEVIFGAGVCSTGTIAPALPATVSARPTAEKSAGIFAKLRSWAVGLSQ